MSGWVIAREAVIVATPACFATMARVMRPLARLLPACDFVIGHTYRGCDSDIIRQLGPKGRGREPLIDCKPTLCGISTRVAHRRKFQKVKLKHLFMLLLSKN